MMRSRFRTALANTVTGAPSPFTTRMRSSRLPGVCPFQSTSSAVQYAHCTKKKNAAESTRSSPESPSTRACGSLKKKLAPK